MSFGAASATSSMEQFDPVLSVKITPAFSAAFAEAISPSGWANMWPAVGEIPIGIDASNPRIEVDKSILDTF